ncbi:MAG: hypothetical protein SWL02_09765 [Pseudomonadota bacterium]|nr:hypothetical protein [Pseudomonadota bacterium]
MSNLSIKDKEGNTLKAGDVCFYTERPHSNYTDSIVEIYEDCGILRVRTIVVNGLSGTEYVMLDDKGGQNLELTDYTRTTLSERTGVADLVKIENIKAENVTIELANELYTLSE